MFEVSESGAEGASTMRPRRLAGGTWAGVVRECILGALATQLIAADTQIVSIYHRRVVASCTMQCVNSWLLQAKF